MTERSRPGDGADGYSQRVNSILVLAAHADDETLGCGGTVLRHRAAGDSVTWCIATSATTPAWSEAVVAAKGREIEQVAAAYGFARVYRLGHRATNLTEVDRSVLISQLREVAADAKAETVYCVSGGDIHQDHQALFAGAASAFKPFRSAVRSLLTYETISSTDVAVASAAAFRANMFIDIGEFIDEKLRILTLYASEIAAAPFPRSPETVRALAQVRGAASGFRYAEAFQSIRESRG
jgi:LmbE family N-acetylglucosaminyl deacetylase